MASSGTTTLPALADRLRNTKNEGSTANRFVRHGEIALPPRAHLFLPTERSPDEMAFLESEPVKTSSTRAVSRERECENALHNQWGLALWDGMIQVG